MRNARIRDRDPMRYTSIHAVIFTGELKRRDTEMIGASDLRRCKSVRGSPQSALCNKYDPKALLV